MEEKNSEFEQESLNKNIMEEHNYSMAWQENLQEVSQLTICEWPIISNKLSS